jgi:hypothetical protein
VFIVVLKNHIRKLKIWSKNFSVCFITETKLENSIKQEWFYFLIGVVSDQEIKWINETMKYMPHILAVGQASIILGLPIQQLI